MRAERGVIPLVVALLAVGWSLSAIDRVSAAANLVRITTTLEPPTLTITPGDTVTWRNDDGQRHRMRSTSGPTEFDSGDLDQGESYTITLSTVGTYAYRDDRDPGLSNYWGTLIVAKPNPSATPGPSGGPTPTPVPTGAVIHMAGRAFNPANVTIAVGGVVTWLNDDSREHTATSGGGVFDSGLMSPGATFVRPFTSVGAFPFLCLIHPDMTGTVTVTAAPGTTPPPPLPVSPTPTPVPAAGDVVIVDFAFVPSDLTIDAGTRITFANHGAALHTVTATDGSFDSGLIPANGTYQRVFATPGTFGYLCSLHPTMAGTLRVRGAGGATPPPAPQPTPAATAPPGGVRIVDFAFLPSQIRVPVGTTVTWVNAGVAPHTVTSRDRTFDSGILASRASFTRTFRTPGTFSYLCAIHPDMTGTVLVPAPDGQVPPPAPTPAPSVPPSTVPGVGSVTIVDLAFNPGVLAVPAGGTVRFTNVGAAIHTATALDGSFDSGFLATNESWDHVFAAAGTIEYVCALHPSMVGTIVVGEGSSGPGTGGPGGSPGQSPGQSPSTPGASNAPGTSFPPAADGGSGAGPGGEPGTPITRSAASITIGLLLVIAAIVGGFAVVHGVGRRAAGEA